jgi:hypothetical protein
MAIKKTKSEQSVIQQAGIAAFKDLKTKTELLFHKMIELALHGHILDVANPRPWVVADQLDQEALYSIQERFTKLLGELGHILGPHQEQALLDRLPWLFKPAETHAKE